VIKIVTRQQRARLTRIRGQTTMQPRTFIQAQKEKIAQIKSDAEFQKNFNTDVSRYIIGSSSIAQAQTKRDELLRDQINRIEPRLRVAAIRYINSAFNVVKSKQNAYIKQLINDIAGYDKKADF